MKWFRYVLQINGGNEGYRKGKRMYWSEWGKILIEYFKPTAGYNGTY